MTIIKDTCRLHQVGTGHKRISFDKSFSVDLNLPEKTKLYVEYDDIKKELTIKEL